MAQSDESPLYDAEGNEIWIKVTGKEIYEAIEADGFGVIREEYFDVDPYTKNVSACLIGMGALNLRAAAAIGAGSLEYELNNYDHPRAGYGIANYIINQFDEQEENEGYVLETWEEALAMAKEALSHVWTTVFTLRSLDWEKKFDITLPDFSTLKEAKPIPMFYDDARTEISH